MERIVFFGFSSFAIAGWLLPGLVLALGVMSACYWKIWKEFKRTTLIMEAALKILGTMEMVSGSGDVTPNHWQASASASSRSVAENAKRDVSHIQVARRSSLFIAVLLLGWGFAAVTAIYELTVGHATEWLVTAVGVGGVSHSWWVPIVYTYTSEFHQKTMKRLFGWVCIPCRGKAWWKDAWSQKAKTFQESTMGSNEDSSLRGNSSQPGSLSPVFTSQRNRHSRSQSPSFVRPPPPTINAAVSEIQSPSTNVLETAPSPDPQNYPNIDHTVGLVLR